VGRLADRLIIRNGLRLSGDCWKKTDTGKELPVTEGEEMVWLWRNSAFFNCWLHVPAGLEDLPLELCPWQWLHTAVLWKWAISAVVVQQHKTEEAVKAARILRANKSFKTLRFMLIVYHRLVNSQRRNSPLILQKRAEWSPHPNRGAGGLFLERSIPQGF